MFYEVSALLLIDDLSSSKHSGIISIFQKHYVKNERVKKETGKFYKEIFEKRQLSDYDDFTEVNEEDIAQWLIQAENFIKEIEEIIEKLLVK
jgi:uncharacterized protein (UPF0332 family)